MITNYYFLFSNQDSAIKSAKHGKIAGYVKSNINGIDLEGVTVTIVELKKRTNTNFLGNYEICQAKIFKRPDFGDIPVHYF